MTSHTQKTVWSWPCKDWWGDDPQHYALIRKAQLYWLRSQKAWWSR